MQSVERKNFFLNFKTEYNHNHACGKRGGGPEPEGVVGVGLHSTITLGQILQLPWVYYL
jgi:hypothetical protein